MPRPGTERPLRRWLDVLLHTGDSPPRTAAAFAVGVFFGFSPLLGLHTVLGLACAFAFGLNRVAVLLGVYANLPWLLAPYYIGATLAGAALVGTELPPGFAAEMRRIVTATPLNERFAETVTLLRPYLWAFSLGSTVGALLLAAAAYWGALAFLLARRRPLARHGSDVRAR